VFENGEIHFQKTANAHGSRDKK